MSNDIFEKCIKFTAARDLQAAGMYPYFKRVETVQSPVVKIDGKELKVTDYATDPGMTRVGLKYAKAGDLGPFTLVFNNNPFERVDEQSEIVLCAPLYIFTRAEFLMEYLDEYEGDYYDIYNDSALRRQIIDIGGIQYRVSGWTITDASESHYRAVFLIGGEPLYVDPNAIDLGDIFIRSLSPQDQYQCQKTIVMLTKLANPSIVEPTGPRSDAHALFTPWDKPYKSTERFFGGDFIKSKMITALLLAVILIAIIVVIVAIVIKKNKANEAFNDDIRGYSHKRF